MGVVLRSRWAPTTAGVGAGVDVNVRPAQRDRIRRGIARGDRRPGTDRQRPAAVVPGAVRLDVRRQTQRVRAAVDDRARGHDQVPTRRHVNRRVDRPTVNAPQCQTPQAIEKYAAGLVRRTDRADHDVLLRRVSVVGELYTVAAGTDRADRVERHRPARGGDLGGHVVGAGRDDASGTGVQADRPAVAVQARASPRTVVQEDLARAAARLDDQGRGTGVGRHRGSREADHARLAAVAHGDRAGGGRLDSGQLGIGQVDARHRIVRPTQAHGPRGQRRADDHASRRGTGGARRRELAHRAVATVRHVEVAAAVEGQAARIIQPGEGGAGRGAPRCELAHRVVYHSWPRRGCRCRRRPGRKD